MSKKKNEKKKKTKVLRRLMKIFPRKLLFVLSVITVIIISIITILFSYLIKELIDSAIYEDMNRFNTAFKLLIVFVLCVLIFTYIKTKSSGIYAESGVKKLRMMVGDKLAKVPYAKLSSHHSGDYVSRATNDMNKVKMFLSETITRLIAVPITTIGATTYLVIISWKLTLLSLATIPIMFLGASLLSKPLGRISKRMQEKLSTVNAIVVDVIKGVEVSKAYNLEKQLGTTYDQNVDDTVMEGKNLAKSRAILYSYSDVIGIIPFVVTVFVGGLWAINKEFSPGNLLAFISLLNFVRNPIAELPRLLGDTKVSMAAGERVIELLDYEEERTDGEAFDLNDANMMIEFDHVSFAYPTKNELVIKEMSFQIRKGESVALVGPSGCGKSTIMKLVLGYFNNYSGEIKIGEHKLETWNLKRMRSNLAFVSQDTYLFPESIEENISYGNIYAPKENIIEAAKNANAHTFIESFPSGYATLVGELGNKLSGGQKQRLSIARAFLKDANVLLLDEATSALDNESEALVQDALNKIIKDKTSLVIAHRLSTIKNVDRILVLSEGKIVEEGSHEELLKIEGLYSQLYKKQLKNEESTFEGKVE